MLMNLQISIYRDWLLVQQKFLYTLLNVVRHVYHSFIKPWRIVYEEAPADARSCQQHTVHSDWDCAGEHG